MLGMLVGSEMCIRDRSITLPDDQIKEIGTYKAVVKLHREVKVEIDFEIKAE